MQQITANHIATNTPKTFTPEEWEVKKQQTDINGKLVYQFLSIDEVNVAPTQSQSVNKSSSPKPKKCGSCGNKKK